MAEAIHRAALAAQARRESWGLLGLSLPALTLVSVILFLPTGWLFALSFLDKDGGLTLENYARLFGSQAYVTIYLTTFKVSVLVTALSAAIGYPLAYMIAQLPARAASLCLLTVLLPLWTSLLVRTYAWLVLLQRNGVINTALIDLGLIDEPLKLAHNFTGATIGMTHIMVPFLVLPLYAAMKAIDPAHLRAATSLGASPVRVFRDVFLPLSLPGLFVGCALVFVLCLGFYVTPALLGGGKVIMIAMRIDLNLRLYNSWGAASALGVVLLVATMLILLLAVRLGRIRLAALGS
ncbi:MAG: ABC transporter permease [Dongiaceae bacterium]